MTECGLYRVVGPRDYRGHPTGTEFPARLERQAEYRAVMRGAIERFGSVTPKPEHFTFPDGWLAADSTPDHRGAERRLTH